METRIIILSTNGTLLPIYEILCIAYPEDAEYDHWGVVVPNGSFVRQRIHDMLHRMIESCRHRGRVTSNIHGYVNWFCSHVQLPPYPYHALTVDHQGNVNADCLLSDKRDFRTLVRDLAMGVLFQLEEFGLYNENGFLEYEFLSINNSSFNEIALKRIPQLIPNGASYEPTR